MSRCRVSQPDGKKEKHGKACGVHAVDAISKGKEVNQEWWCMHTIPALRQWRREGHEFKVILRCILSLGSVGVT